MPSSNPEKGYKLFSLLEKNGLLSFNKNDTKILLFFKICNDHVRL
jgi:hypothetical protein